MPTQKTKFAAVAATLLMTCAAPIATAQEQIKVTVLSGYTDRTSWVHNLKEFFMPEVNKRLAETGNYSLKYTEAFGTVVKPRGEFDALQNGIGTIGLIVTAFHTDKVPLSSVSYVTPFVSTDLGLTSEVNDAITHSIPEVKAGWEKFGLEFLGHMGTIKSYAVLSKEPIDGLDDFEGIKVSGAGLNLRWIEGLGAVGVPSVLPKFYQEVNSGVAEAMIGWGDVVGAFKLCEVAPHFLSAEMGAVSNFTVVANKRWFDKQPDEVKTALREVTVEYRNLMAEATTAGDAKGREACVAQGGSVTELADDQRQAWADKLPNVAQEWAHASDANGLPGSLVLETYMTKMREAGQPIARQWDQE
ncbi:TRAP transporter substrate-binding protein DctP [Shimia sp.]|uniref:TRAP transporter substrate-binding protein DctP n=1 Tax=Shimia sp. TaxID=1954381 RepID=UPI003297305E